YLTGAASNYSFYSSPKVDDLYAQQSRVTDLSERKKIIGEMEKTVLEDRPMFFAFWRIYSTLVGPRVRNYLFTNIYSGQKLEDVWLAR
ncbi:MAG: hypothetical protein Q8O76_13785, partial [Chloroflexota bacterium]|nr:hypothetical protein [Chloroflexota bacterium]